MSQTDRPLALVGRGIVLGGVAGAFLAGLYTLLAIPLFGLMLLLTNMPTGKVLDALLGLGAFAICAGPFALVVGILPALATGGLAGLLISLAILPWRRRLSGRGAALIGLGVAAIIAMAANLVLGSSLLQTADAGFGRHFTYLFWLGAPSLAALAAGAAVGWASLKGKILRR